MNHLHPRNGGHQLDHLRARLAEWYLDNFLGSGRGMHFDRVLHIRNLTLHVGEGLGSYGRPILFGMTLHFAIPIGGVQNEVDDHFYGYEQSCRDNGEGNRYTSYDQQLENNCQYDERRRKKSTGEHIRVTKILMMKNKAPAANFPNAQRHMTEVKKTLIATMSCVFPKKT